jgi:hypothetical protein
MDDQAKKLTIGLAVLGAAVLGFALLGRKAGAKPPPPPGLANIYGIVTDEATGQPLAGATVDMQGATDVTDTDGRYDLGPFQPAEYVLSAYKENYEVFSTRVTLQEGNNEVNITIRPVMVPPPPGGVEVPLERHVFITGIDGKKIIEESPGVYSLESPIPMSSLHGVNVNFRYEGDPYLEADPGAWAGFAGYLAYFKAGTGEAGPGFQGTVGKGGPGYVSAIPVMSPWIVGPSSSGLYDGVFNIRLYPYGIMVGDFTIKGVAQV